MTEKNEGANQVGIDRATRIVSDMYVVGTLLPKTVFGDGPMMKLPAVLVMLALGMSPALAQEAVSVKAGTDGRVGGAWNCSIERLPIVILTPAKSGTLSTRELVENPCGNTAKKMVGIFYRPNPGFKGKEEVFYEVQFSSGNYQRQRKVITVQYSSLGPLL